MRAITVLPGVANSARLDEVPDPPASDGAVLARTLGARGVRHRSRDRLRAPMASAPAGDQRLVLGHELLGEVVTAPQGQRLCARRPRGRHRATTRSGTLPRMRGRRVGYVPQRPLHRARHQGPARLRRRALPHRAGIRRQGRSGARHARRPARARQRRRQGMGSTEADRAACAGVETADACWSPAPVRSACWRR